MRIFSVLASIAVCLILLWKSHTEAQSVIPSSTVAIDVLGGLEPYKITDVSTAEIGVVSQILIKRGERVVQGQPISQLDDRQQTATLKEAEADAQAIGQLETIKHEMEFNKRRVDITKQLVDQGKGSPRELERYQLEYEIAKAKLVAAEEAKSIAAIRSNKAKLLLDTRTIAAPHDGVIEEIYRTEGEFIAANSPSIARLVDASKLRASFMLPESLAEQFRHQKTAEIRLPSGVIVTADIEFIGVVASVDGRTIAMTALIDNQDELIRSAHCELVVQNVK